MTRASELLRQVAQVWAPPPKERLSEWAEKNFVLSPEYSAATGPLILFPYQREPLDCFTDPYVREIVIMSATQMLKTLVLQCIIAYLIARDPAPTLLAQPTTEDADSFSKERIAPMLRDIPCLQGKVETTKGSGSTSTLRHKAYPGGFLSLIGAQTPGNFSRRSVRVFLADERDKWKKKVGKEGDGFSLGVKRGATFRSRFKVVQVCSPTVKGNSQIGAAYEASDQRKPWVPCYKCGHRQVLTWEQVRWEAADPRGTAHYLCENTECGAHWNDAQRWDACGRLEWRAGKPFRGVAGFWISELYSPWKTLGDIVEDFLLKKDDNSELQTFVNTTLAELWVEPGEEPANWETLKGRREEYRRGEAPEGVLFVTAGADVQKDRIVVDFWGWGRRKNRWFLDRQVLMGDTSRAEVWQQFDVARASTFRHSSGLDLSVIQGAIDSGYATTEVYAWARGKRDWIVIKGTDKGGALLGQPQAEEVRRDGKAYKSGIRVWPLQVSMAKDELYSQLRQAAPKCPLCDGNGCANECPPKIYPTGWVHFPIDAEEEWFREICAERYVTRYVKGYKKGEWFKERERNEALDCANYARAAATHMRMDQASNRWWEAWESHIGAERPAPPQPSPNAPAPAAAKPAPGVSMALQRQTGRVITRF